jgi:hypothetical protein
VAHLRVAVLHLARWRGQMPRRVTGDVPRSE